MTNADKALKMEAALKQLGAEYSRRGDVIHAIREFLDGVGPSQLAMLHDLVVSNDTPENALDALSLDAG